MFIWRWVRWPLTNLVINESNGSSPTNSLVLVSSGWYILLQLWYIPSSTGFTIMSVASPRFPQAAISCSAIVSYCSFQNLPCSLPLPWWLWLLLPVSCLSFPPLCTWKVSPSPLHISLPYEQPLPPLFFQRHFPPYSDSSDIILRLPALIIVPK